MVTNLIGHVGVNVCIQIGWFPTYTITEDYALSMELKKTKCKGRYLPLNLVVSHWHKNYVLYSMHKPCSPTAAVASFPPRDLRLLQLSQHSNAQGSVSGLAVCIAGTALWRAHNKALVRQ